MVILFCLSALACESRQPEEAFAVISSSLCVDPNTTFCEWPTTSGDCVACGGTWESSGYCDQTAFCDNAGSCVEICAGTWIDGTCRTPASQQDCLTYAELYGNVWVTTETCSGQNASFCSEPSSSEACAVCDGTWNASLCVDPNPTLCEVPATSGDCVVCGGVWTTSGFCDQTELCDDATLCSEVCVGTWVANTCQTSASQQDCLAYAEPYGNVWVPADTCFGHDALFCSAPLSSEVCAVCNGTWNASLCVDPNPTLCEVPATSGDCVVCGGTWTTSGFCDQTEFCDNPTLCSEVCGGTWVDNTCRTPASQQNCLTYAELYGNVWVPADTCFGHDALFCSEPLSSEVCAACSGTWSG